MAAVPTDIRDIRERDAFHLLRCFESGGGAFDCFVARLATSHSTASCWREGSPNDAFGHNFPRPHVRRYVRLRGRGVIGMLFESMGPLRQRKGGERHAE